MSAAPTPYGSASILTIARANMPMMSGEGLTKASKVATCYLREPVCTEY